MDRALKYSIRPPRTVDNPSGDHHVVRVADGQVYQRCPDIMWAVAWAGVLDKEERALAPRAED